MNFNLEFEEHWRFIKFQTSNNALYFSKGDLRAFKFETLFELCQHIFEMMIVIEFTTKDKSNQKSISKDLNLVSYLKIFNTLLKYFQDLLEYYKFYRSLIIATVCVRLAITLMRPS